MDLPFVTAGRCRRPASLPFPSGCMEAHGAPNTHRSSCHPHYCRASAPTSPLHLLTASYWSSQTVPPSPSPSSINHAPSHTSNPTAPSCVEIPVSVCGGDSKRAIRYMSSLPSPEQYHPPFRSQAGLPPAPGVMFCD